MSILSYWKSHPQYWIAGARAPQADAEIVAAWWGYDLTHSNFLDQVIYYDQFLRHFSRVPSTGVSEDDVREGRRKAALLTYENKAALASLTDVELVFALMPLKHTSDFQTIFAAVDCWLPHGKSLNDYPQLSRFYNDTYKKAYGLPGAVAPILKARAEADYDSDAITAACPPAALWCTGELPAEAEPLCDALKRYGGDAPVVSLSGGVDSMVLAALAVRSGLKVRALHIKYGNRDVSSMECDLLADYCAALGVPFYVYSIEWLRRGLCDRAFYERMTRTLRFAAYKAIRADRVCLGHIQEDVVENIWTNFAHGAHLDHLAKMSPVATEDDVCIVRPWLNVPKTVIYKIADALHIPHLKNTTPLWSNRGKFRSAFYEATHAQYGTSVDSKLLHVAEQLRKQALMLEKLLYQPVYDSWTPCATGGIVNIRSICDAGGLDGEGWSKVLTTLCHTRCGIGKPSIHACNALSERLTKPVCDSIRVPMKKDLTLLIVKKADCVLMHLLYENTSVY